MVGGFVTSVCVQLLVIFLLFIAGVRFDYVSDVGGLLCLILWLLVYLFARFVRFVVCCVQV